MSTPFRQHTDVLSKSPATAHGLAGRSPASAEEGGLLFGDFLLAIQEKATRAPKVHESSCSMAHQNRKPQSGNAHD